MATQEETGVWFDHTTLADWCKSLERALEDGDLERVRSVYEDLDASINYAE